MTGISNKKTVRDFDVKGKRVLLRCDFNVPIKNEKILDDTRIAKSIETIKYLVENKAKVIIMSHLGRPEGRVYARYTLLQILDTLVKHLGQDVNFCETVSDENAKNMAFSLKDGEVMLLENVRFEPGETENDRELSKRFADMGEIFINDAFGASHRKHSSTYGISEFLPTGCGLLVEKELKFLGGAMENPERPFMAVVGGSKVSDKIEIINSLMDKVDTLMIGGAMTYTFFKALGYTVGKSIVEEDKLDLAKSLIKKAKEKGVEFMIPIDSIAAKAFEENSEFYITDEENIMSGYMGLDIGIKTMGMYIKKLYTAKTILWNGPVGVYEWEHFSKGTFELGRSMSMLTDRGQAVTIIGGGDLGSAMREFGFDKRLSFISTGGGASLEFLEGKELPGISCIDEKGD